MSDSKDSCPSPFGPGEAQWQLPLSPLFLSSLLGLYGTEFEKNEPAATCAAAVPQPGL